MQDEIPQENACFSGHSDLIQERNDSGDFAVNSRKRVFVAPAIRIGEEATHEKTQFLFVIFIVSHVPKASSRAQIV